MNFSTLYRVSFYVMLFFASLVLSVDAPESKIAMLYPLGVGAAGLLAFMAVDGRRPSTASALLFNLLAVGSAALALLEYVLDNDMLLLALGHWLIYLEVLLMFRPKTAKEDWELFLLGLVQVLVGAVISQSDLVGAMLFIWAILALWVLGLFALQREATRATADSPPRDPGAVGAGEFYPGLLNIPFLVSALRVTLTTLALGGVIFLAMPRRPTMARSQAGDPVGQHLTGFDDEVQLGQMGEILENDSVVMTVELFNEKGVKIPPGGEPLWRGVTMTTYADGRWHRQGKRIATFPIIPPGAYRTGDASRPRSPVRQQIKLEPNDSNVLFGLRPMIDASAGRRLPPDLNKLDGTISRPDTRSGSYDYEVWSFLDDELPQPGEASLSPYWKLQLLNVPGDLGPRLKTFAEKVIAADLPPDRRDDVRARARALEQHLRSGLYGYTLKLDVVDRTIDPVEDFLVNRKEGHCEYFASTLTLLLRSVGIPARMVNGFKGGDYNDIAMVTSVRQKHAHSWVEAFTGEGVGPDRSPLWLTLDPTPGAERDRSVARVGGFTSNFRQLSDLVRYVWVFYVVGYNAERQNKLLYEPVQALLSVAREGFSLMGQGIANFWPRLRGLLHFENAGAFISVRGFGVSFTALLLLAGVVRTAAALVRFAVRRFRGQDDRSLALSVGAAHYRRLAALLQPYGLERPPAETQDEFARRANVFLTARGSHTEAVADVPRVVVDAFYRVRFGRLDLAADTLANLETRLDALEATLTASQE